MKALINSRFEDCGLVKLCDRVEIPTFRMNTVSSS